MIFVILGFKAWLSRILVQGFLLILVGLGCIQDLGLKHFRVISNSDFAYLVFLLKHKLLCQQPTWDFKTLKNIIEFNVGSNVVNTELNPNVAAFENVICCQFCCYREQWNNKEAANFTTRSIIIKHMYMYAAHGNIDPASKPGSSWVDGFIIQFKQSNIKKILC